MALSDNLVAYWKLDESSGDASDSVGSKTLTNNNSVAYSTGKINNGADFGSSNTNKYLSATALSFMSGLGGGAISVSLWVKIQTAPSLNTQATIFTAIKSTNVSSTDFGIQFAYHDVSGTKKVYLWSPRTGLGADVTQTLTVGTWYHIALSSNGSTWTLYLNGSSIASGSVGAGNNIGTQDFMRCGAYSASTEFLSGNVDEIGIWSRGISSTEVTQLYNSGNGNQYPFGTAYTISLATGYYNLTGETIVNNRSIHLYPTTGYYTLTGYDTVLQKIRSFVLNCATGFYNLTGQTIRTALKSWVTQSKHTASFSQQTKNSATWTNQTRS